MSLIQILNNIGAVLTIGLGLMGLVFPNAAAMFTSIQPKGSLGISEIRATYGGFFLAAGAYALWMQNEVVFSAIGVAWFGAAIGRIVSICIGDNRVLKNFRAVLFEGVIGLLLFVR